ncbi:MAG TPA: hypothetical protein ACFCUD_07045 [Cyclobacteriaceae bacterium]
MQSDKNIDKILKSLDGLTPAKAPNDLKEKVIARVNDHNHKKNIPINSWIYIAVAASISLLVINAAIFFSFWQDNNSYIAALANEFNIQESSFYNQTISEDELLQ